MNLNEVLNAIDAGPPSLERAKLKSWAVTPQLELTGVGRFIGILPPRNRRYAPERGPAGRRPALPPWGHERKFLDAR
jgi:hypothetical protein